MTLDCFCQRKELEPRARRSPSHALRTPATIQSAHPVHSDCTGEEEEEEVEVEVEELVEEYVEDAEEDPEEDGLEEDAEAEEEEAEDLLGRLRSCGKAVGMSLWSLE